MSIERDTVGLHTFMQDRMEALIGSEILQPLVCGAITLDTLAPNLRSHRSIKS